MSPSGRWYTGSGIIRPVHLLIDNQAHFNRNGITLTTPTLDNAIITSAVCENGVRYLNGEIGLDEAVNAVIQQVNLYLAE